MKRHIEAGLLLAGAAIALWALGACQGGAATATGPEAVVLGAMAGDSGHEAPDPRVPPVCHGYTATIWYNMPADLIPRTAIVRPMVPGGDEHAGDTTSEHEDEAPGWVIVGTNGPDVIVGSPQRDSISGGNGDDVICADPPQHETPGGDEDEECSGEGSGGSMGSGGGGPDWVWGGNGADLLFGGGGPDRLWGGNGDDVIYGGGGPDTIYAGNGNDVVQGGGGPDVIWGELGDDQLFGGPAFDKLDGGKGNNVLDPGDQGEDSGGCGGGHDAAAPSSSGS